MHSAPQAPNRDIYLIQPKFPPSYWGQEYFIKMTDYGAVYPPLGLITLAALTPADFHVTLCDESAGETIDFATKAGIVGLTGYLFQMEHVFEIADRFREAGKTVVLGGPMATLVPEECRAHCDVLFEGEAEYTWPRFLKEYATGSHADNYHEHDKIHLPDSLPPRLDVLKKTYSQGIVQCTRGCPFSCEFCDIIVMFGRKVRFKPVEQVIQEIEGWQARGTGKVFFADDNFVGHRAYAKELLRAIIDWNSKQRAPIAFYTQASIDMVRDEELLGMLRDANFFGVFLGIESPRKASLAEAQKTQNEKLDLVKAVHKIQSYNLFVWAGMIVGFDQDDADIFQEQFDFLQAAQIPIAMINALEAVPRTPLYKRLQAEGRLLETSYAGEAATSRYQTGVGMTNFRPVRMTNEELTSGLGWLFEKLYSPEAFSARLLGNLSRFHDVKFRPERMQASYPIVFLRLVRYFWSKGWGARKFFWGNIFKTLRRAPRIVGQTIIYMGMYAHFCEVHRMAAPWDPWAPPARPKKPPVARRRAAVVHEVVEV